MERKLVSIIIPTYNRKQYLIEAVESCLNQTYPNIEVIIVDDGSTDGTEEMVKSLLTSKWKDKPLKYFKQKNTGASAARNKGLDLSKGDYIQFLDSDDLLLPEKISRQVKVVNDFNADGCSCLGIIGESLQNSNDILGESFNVVEELMHKMCSGRVHVMSTPAPLWKKSVLLKTNGWNSDLAFGDDLEFHIRVLVNVKKMAFVNEKLFFVREHQKDRLSNSINKIKQIESGILTQQLVTKTLKDHNLWDKEFQKGLLKRSRTLYANYLSLAKKESIIFFENFLLELAKIPQLKVDMMLIILLRKILGAKFVLFAFSIKSRVLK